MPCFQHFRKGTEEANAQSAVMMTFVLSFSVGIAIMVLLGWHIYLILTAQTTIDFYQNQTNRARARQFGEVREPPPAFSLARRVSGFGCVSVAPLGSGGGGSVSSILIARRWRVGYPSCPLP